MKIYPKAFLPKSFKAHALSCGIKRKGRLDLALLYSTVASHASACFTSNALFAAPVALSKKHLAHTKKIQAVLVNSGNANCFTGSQGLKDAESCAEVTAFALGMRKEQVLVASTGIIGKKLPSEKITASLPGLVGGLSKDGISLAARAILTTDAFTKECTLDFKIGAKSVRICGIAKGAGMIAPDMATMLCVMLTDADISPFALKKALKGACDASFNCITVDGCMSTNDTVAIVANGAAGNPEIKDNSYFEAFLEALKTVSLSLAKMIVKDGEGATKFIRIRVEEAKSLQEARTVGLAIANSNLFKCAMYGQDPNFGRVVAAIGASGVAVKEKNLKVRLSRLDKKQIEVNVRLKRGAYSCDIYTSDLTPEYIKINAAYN